MDTVEQKRAAQLMTFHRVALLMADSLFTVTKRHIDFVYGEQNYQREAKHTLNRLIQNVKAVERDYETLFGKVYNIYGTQAGDGLRRDADYLIKILIHLADRANGDPRIMEGVIRAIDELPSKEVTDVGYLSSLFNFK